MSAVSSGTCADLPVRSATRTGSSDGKTSRRITGRRRCSVLRDRLRKRSRPQAIGADVPREPMPDRSPWEHLSYESLVVHRPDVMDCSLGIGPRGVHRESVPKRNIGALVRRAVAQVWAQRSVRAQRSSRAPRAARAASRQQQAPASGSYWIVRRRLGFVTVIASISSSDTPAVRRRGRNVSAR